MARLGYTVTIISILVCVLVCVLADEELYSDKYDHIDAEAILQNEKLRQQYYNCFMETGPCVTADAKYFKDIFSEALQSQCKKCTEKQKEVMNIIADWYTKNQPDKWELVVAKTVEDMKKKNAGK